MTGNLEYCENQVRHDDKDRYLTALFAPADRRAGIFALYAFNLEIAKIRDLVSEPQLGLIRLEWWREALAGIYRGAPPQHPVAAELSESILRHNLPRETFDLMIEARSADLIDDTFQTLEGLVEYAAGSGSALVSLALQVLGVGQNQSAAHKAGHHVGIAWALTSLRRTRVLPVSNDRILETVRLHLDAARALRNKVPKEALPALLPAVLAGRRLGRLGRHKRDPSPLDQLALYVYAVTGRY